MAAPVEPPENPEPRMTAEPPHQLENEVFQERLSRTMDATKDYAHNFREKGRYGSHPSHDNYDDEGQA
jgi:hypothetical protein